MNLKQFKSEWKLLKRFYIFNLLWGLGSFLPAYWIVYFQSVGFSFKEISTIIAMIMVAPIIFEVPTGAIADYFGRRISVAIGMIVMGLFLALIPFAKGFWQVIIIFFIGMSFATLISGAESAWLVDYLKSKRKSHLVRTAFSRIMSIIAIGGSVALIGASFVVKHFGMSYLWYIQGILMILAGLFAVIFGDKEKIIKKGNFRQVYKSTFGFAKQGFKLIFLRRTLFFFTLAIFFNEFFSMAGIVWQPFFIELGIKLEHLGLIYAAGVFVGVIAPNLSNKFVEFAGSEKRALILEDLTIGLLFIFVSIVTSPLIAIILFYSGAFGESMGHPIRSAFFHKRIPSKIRATTDSIKNLIKSSGGIIAMLLAGFIVDGFGLRAALFIGGLAAIPTVICFMMIKDEK